jgi:hypothetical protein
MSSKLWMLMCLMIGLTGCERFLRSNQDQSPEAQTLKLEFKEGQCLKAVPAQLQKFMADEDGLGSAVPCVQTALSAFMRQTRGEKADSYKAKELQDFFNTYLLKENKITNDFQDDIMKLKMLVVGGSSDVVTRAELERFSEFLGDLEKQLGKFKGRVRYLSLKADRQRAAAQDLGALKKDVTGFADFILKNTKFTSSQYQWSDFLTFLGHLRQFVGEMKAFDEVMTWMPLIDSAKTLFLGANTSLQTQKDWTETKIWLINGYAAVLKYHYQIMGSPFQKPSEWTSVIGWTDEVVTLLETAPLMKEKKIFDAVAIDHLLDEALKKKLVRTTLSPELIKQTYRKALAYFVESPSSQPDPMKVKGLTEDHLKVLKAEYNIWKATQVFIDRSFEENPNQTLESLRQRFQTIDSKGFPAVPAADRPEYNQAWQDFRELLNSANVILNNDQLKVEVDYQSPQASVSFVGSNMLNAVRSLGRFALRGYGDKESVPVFKRKISKKRMMDIEENFREFGRKVGFFDPDKTTAGKETFDQANLLVYHSNGDEWVDARELIEVLSFLISGGKTVLDDIYAGLDRNHCLVQERDAFGRPWVEEACFLKALRGEMEIYFKNLPGVVQFFSKTDDTKFQQAYQSLLKVSIGPRHRAGMLESGEIRSMATILHFVEAITVTYDRDHSGLLSQAEVLAAYPRFKDVIKDQALKENFLAGFVLDDIYLFLVYKGKKPSGGWDITKLLAEKHFGGLGEVDKLMIYNLLGVMKEYLSNAPKK